MFKSPNGTVTWMIFYNANDTEKSGVFCKINIFSETISSGRTYFAIWSIKHYLTLLVESIQGHGWINFHSLRGIFPGFMLDPYRITLEL